MSITNAKLQQIYEEHSEGVRNYLQHNYGISTQDAWDIWHETIMIAKDKLDVKRPALPFLIQVAKNIVRYRHRKATRDKTNEAEVARRLYNPSKTSVDIKKIAEEALRQLRGREYCVVRAWIEGWTKEEIWKMWQYSNRRVYSLIAKVRKLKQKELALC